MWYWIGVIFWIKSVTDTSITKEQNKKKMNITILNHKSWYKRETFLCFTAEPFLNNNLVQLKSRESEEFERSKVKKKCHVRVRYFGWNFVLVRLFQKKGWECNRSDFCLFTIRHHLPHPLPRHRQPHSVHHRPALVKSRELAGSRLTEFWSSAAPFQNRDLRQKSS